MPGVGVGNLLIGTHFVAGSEKPNQDEIGKNPSDPTQETTYELVTA